MGAADHRAARGAGAAGAGAVLVVLLVALVVGIAPNLTTRVVSLGEALWPGYAAELRVDPKAPECDLAVIEAQLSGCPEGAAAEAAPGPEALDLFGDEDPFAEVPADEVRNCPALRASRDACAERLAAHRGVVERLTPTVRAFRSLDLVFGGLARFAYWKHLLVVLVGLGLLTTTARGAHIALREPRTTAEYRLAQGAQLLAHLLLLASATADWWVQRQSTAEVENPALPVLWAAGFAGAALLNALHLARAPRLSGKGSVARSLMVIPLYAWMVAIAGFWFLVVERHPSGQAIYLHRFVQHPSVYVGIGLYIWAGMLLSRTRLARLVFGALTPWGLPPALLAWLVVVLAAVPTAYSGASGIFVIAAGAVIFEQLRAGGADRRLALAATAMSGSLGVVLRPCLVVVLISIMNKQVTTDALFGNGLGVFALTSVLFLVAMLWRNRDGWHLHPPRQALGASGRALAPLAPYLLVGLGVFLVIRVVLGMRLTEHTASLVLPAVLLALVGYEVVAARGKGEVTTLWQPLSSATSETSTHVGALLLVMVGSVGLGGVVERAHVMDLVPADLGGVFPTMAVLVVAMVLIGMTMDALGAVVLVSVSLAGVAYRSGIDPVHFWMMVLVAFELGYLTPPVALNHLLARQVIGPEARLEDDPSMPFLRRYEHILLPMAVMGTALVNVAFVPLFFY